MEKNKKKNMKNPLDKMLEKAFGLKRGGARSH